MVVWPPFWRERLARLEGRITELLESGNRLLDEARAARRKQAEAEFGEQHWRRVAMELRARLHRIDDTWKDRQP